MTTHAFFDFCPDFWTDIFVAFFYEKVYEDNANGKVTDEWFMEHSHKYEVERMELKERIAECRKKLENLDKQ